MRLAGWLVAIASITVTIVSGSGRERIATERGGTGLLGATGHAEYAVAWVAAAVGMHFLAFGRLFWAGFYWVGAALIAAGMAGAMVGVAGGGSDGITATTGLMAAASLFLASGWSVLQATGQQRHLTETVSRS